MAMPIGPLGDNAVLARFLRAAGDNVPTALLAVGTATCAAAVRAAASPPAGGNPVCLVALAGAFFGGQAAMLATVWVAADHPRREATGRIILCAALVPLVIAVGLGSDAAGLVLGIFDAMV